MYPLIHPLIYPLIYPRAMYWQYLSGEVQAIKRYPSSAPYQRPRRLNTVSLANQPKTVVLDPSDFVSICENCSVWNDHDTYECPFLCQSQECSSKFVLPHAHKDCPWASLMRSESGSFGELSAGLGSRESRGTWGSDWYGRSDLLKKSGCVRGMCS